MDSDDDSEEDDSDDEDEEVSRLREKTVSDYRMNPYYTLWNYLCVVW